MGFLVIPTESRAQELAASLFEGNLGKSQEQEVLETFSGFMELLDEEKLKKLDKLDDLSSIKSNQERLEKKITSVEQKMSDYVKPVTLDQKDRDTLNELNSQLDKRNQRFSKFCRIISDKKIWFLYIFLTASLSVGTTILIMKNSPHFWAHWALVAAEESHMENPLDEYSKAFAQMRGSIKARNDCKDRIEGMESDARYIKKLGDDDLHRNRLRFQFLCLEVGKVFQDIPQVRLSICRTDEPIVLLDTLVCDLRRRGHLYHRSA